MTPPAAAPLTAAEAGLVSTIYSPPRARRPWAIGEVLPPGATTYYSLARWAFVEALRACGIGRGDRVLIPGLICRDVLASVNVLGAVAVFYPVSPQLSPVSLDPATGAKAVLAVNYFGFPQDLRPFRQFCADTGAALIEDNAHGLFSRDEDGGWLGGRGDAGLFSFRKTIAVPDGGALVVSRGSQQPPRVTPVNRPALRYHAKQTIRRVAASVDPARTMNVIAAVRSLRGSPDGDASSSSDRDAETRIPLTANPSAMIVGDIKIADPQLESDRRRALYQLSRRILEPTGASPVFRELPGHVVPYGFPLLVSDSQATAVSARLAQHGLSLLRWPALPATIAASAPDHYHRLMVVPFLW